MKVYRLGIDLRFALALLLSGGFHYALIKASLTFHPLPSLGAPFGNALVYIEEYPKPLSSKRRREESKYFSKRTNTNITNRKSQKRNPHLKLKTAASRKHFFPSPAKFQSPFSMQSELIVRYPFLSRRLGEEGEVLCRVWIDRTGAVKDVALISSSGYRRLDGAAMASIRKAHFAPHPSAGGYSREIRVIFKLR
ncbi:MAG: energy transducer TonB [Candidatus Dadabacteria bacterium]|nr:MAG: energy transducer TonB [Candidatus Dadabacteria bacterium]